MEIYLITDLLHGLKYVGQTIHTKERRWKAHLRSSETSAQFVHWAMRTYGVENFKVETICKCPDQKALDEAERFFIWILGTTKVSFGYNISVGGKGHPVLSSEELKRKEEEKNPLNREETFSSISYIVNWPGAMKNINLDKRSFFNLGDASDYAREQSKVHKNVRIEELLHVMKIKKIPEHEWILT